jgi:ABC-2 type transport system permease protein
MHKKVTQLASTSKPVYDSASYRVSAISELKELGKYRYLLGQLIRRDILTRYKRSVLGILWTMLNPLGTMIILSVVFSRLFEMRGVYPAYIITNLMAWNFFSQTTQFSLSSTLWGSDLLKQIYLPRTSFIIATIGTGVVNILLTLIPMLLIFLVTKVPVTYAIVAFPIALIILSAFNLGVSLLISTLGVFFPDISQFYPVVLTAWMYLTPIIYPESLLYDVFHGLLLTLNPLYHEIKLFQRILFQGVFPTLTEWLIAAGISLVVLVLGWVIFTNKSKTFGYYV